MTSRLAKLALCLAAVSMAAPGMAEVRHHHHYRRQYYRRHYRGDCAADAHRRGANGAIIGAVGGGVIGGAAHGGVGGTLLGAGVGALAGHAIGRSTTRC
ncbi:MAG TPA: hypothetical protein VFC47_06050 [Caulobacteraceae bacterium]|nr:hypothetical protein [Caulobacteraceae bacterium]